MSASYLVEIASLGLRWLHLIVGIAWIGSSFYFVWLDNSLVAPQDDDLKRKGVLGELWAMHAGGFYNPQKYAVAPASLPDRLHFFFWPSYSTWTTGFLLMSTLYYFNASSYMIDPAKWITSPGMAVSAGVATLVIGWIVYDVLCRLLIDRSQLLFAVCYTAFVAIMACALQHALSGRAAYIHIGAMIATAMTGNVFFIIIPGQRRIVASMKRGEAPDPLIGKKSKQRSVHNNYLTLPVLFAMISNHYAFTYAHPWGWSALVAIMIASALARHFFNLKHKGQWRWRYLVASGVIFLVVFLLLAPKPPSGQASAGAAEEDDYPIVTLADIRPIIHARCVGCHSMRPTLLPAAPAGLVLDTPEQVHTQALRIHMQVVMTEAMPPGNISGITPDERALIAAWVEDGLVKEPGTPPTSVLSGSPPTPSSSAGRSR